MPTVLKYKGYIVYFTSHCLDEPIHFHINKGLPTELGSAKVWILSNGSLKVVDSGAINRNELKKLIGVAELNKKKIIDKWYSVRGSVTYIE